MSYCRRPGYVRVREDSDLVVFAERPDIRPRELSAELTERFGIDHFRFSLQRNVYVIYVDRGAVAPQKGYAVDEETDGDVVVSGLESSSQVVVNRQHHIVLPAGKASADHNQPSGLGIRSAKLQDYKRRSEDVKLAKQALRTR